MQPYLFQSMKLHALIEMYTNQGACSSQGSKLSACSLFLKIKIRRKIEISNRSTNKMHTGTETETKGLGVGKTDIQTDKQQAYMNKTVQRDRQTDRQEGRHTV